MTAEPTRQVKLWTIRHAPCFFDLLDRWQHMGGDHYRWRGNSAGEGLVVKAQRETLMRDAWCFEWWGDVHDHGVLGSMRDNSGTVLWQGPSETYKSCMGMDPHVPVPWLHAEHDFEAARVLDIPAPIFNALYTDTPGAIR